jgi:hypothetical protein
VDKEGGEWVAIATGEVNPERVLVDESAVYWSNEDYGFAELPPIDLKRMAKGDGVVETLTGAPLAAFNGLVQDDDSLFWMGSPGLMTLSKTGAPPRVLAPDRGGGDIDLLAVYATAWSWGNSLAHGGRPGPAALN